MSDVIKRDIYTLIEKELVAANEKFPLFNGKHETYAVILEEVEEAHEEMINAELWIGEFWREVKGNESPELLHKTITKLYEAAINLSVEAVQVAAMARKGILSSVELLMIDQAQESERGKIT